MSRRINGGGLLRQLRYCSGLSRLRLQSSANAILCKRVVGRVDGYGQEASPQIWNELSGHMPSVMENSTNSPAECAQFLDQLRWNPTATATLRQAAKRQHADGFVSAWRQATLRRAESKLPRGLCLWSWIDTPSDQVVLRLCESIFHAPRTSSGSAPRPAIKTGRHLSIQIAELAELLAERSAAWSPVELITAGELLLSFGKELEPAAVLSLWRRLATETNRLTAADLQETPDQLLLRAGEAPFLAGCLLEPWNEAKRLRQLGRRALVRELIARTDSDGTPHAELVSRMPLWLAPLIRATLWADRFGVPLWSAAERNRLSLVLERAIPLCRPNGRLAMSNGLSIPALPLFDVAAKALSLTGPAQKLLRTLRTAGASAKKKSRAGVESMPSSQSDWARFAMLRSDWSPHADSLAISHHQSFPQLDVAVFGQPLLHGPWGLELQVGETAIEPAAEWSCTCWCSDPDADYLELQMAGPGPFRIERQVLLSRKEHFLLLSDSVRGAQSLLKQQSATSGDQHIHLRSRLPLADGVVGQPNQPTRELLLKAGKQAVRVFPLALIDDRVQSTPHTCEVVGNELVLHQVAAGHGLYAPLVFDWHPARTRQLALWRTLTVTEAGRVLPRDRAAGHRLQIGKFQLLVYRSLSKIAAPRAVLGHHTWQESVIAQVDGRGDVDIIMRVDE